MHERSGVLSNKGWDHKVFSSQEEADNYLKQIIPATDMAPEEIRELDSIIINEIPEISTAGELTSFRYLDNKLGKTVKSDIATVMLSIEDSQWHTFVKNGVTLSPGESWKDDISFMNVKCGQAYINYNEWNGRQWIYRARQAEYKVKTPGNYFLSVGWSWGKPLVD